MFSIDSSLGIEVCGENLVFTVVKRSIGGFAVGQSCVIEGFLQLDKAQLREKLQQIRKHNGFNKENVILGLPRDQVILRKVELPLEAAENLSQLIKYQVEYYQPSEENSSYFDYIVLNQDLERKRLVLLVALARKSWLDPYIERLSANKIVPSRVEVSTSAIFNLVSLKRELLMGKGLVVVFDVNDQASEIVVLRGREEIFSREAHMGPPTCTVDHWLDRLQQLLSEIRIEDGSIDRFYLCGTQAQGLYPRFKERFRETELLAEAVRGKLRAKGDVQLTHSLGFALAPFCRKRSPISLNLIPPERRRVVSKLQYVPTAVLGLMLIAGVVALGLRDYVQAQEFADRLDARIRALEPQVMELKKIQGDIENATADIAYLEEITQNRAITLAVVKELTEKIPQEAYLQMMTIDTQARSVDITGYSSNPTAIQNLLLRSSHLQKVENKYTTFDQRVKKDRFNFRAEIKQ
ncbi:MAG: pilus assembly protein PilM [Acidobacteria bacterium]|nr:pilus assembly protein PilM [Acidobacteriota bacterium]